VPLYKIGIVASAPLAFSIMALVDSVSRESISPKKLFIITIISTGLVIFSMMNNSVTTNISYLGEKTLALTGFFMVFGALTFIFAGTLWFYYMLKIYMRAPNSIKKVARINFIGSIFAGPGSIIAFSTGFVWIIPGTDYFLISIGSLLCAYSFMTEPKLAYVLPFRVYRLMCVNSKSGIPLYTFEWDKQLTTDEMLLAGAVQGVDTLFKEGIGKGSINQVEFEDAIMILYRDQEYDIMFVLISSKFSMILKESLEIFGKAFIKKFKESLNDEIINSEIFKPTINLINEIFPYIPIYN
ncbi:MAG: hypothetical protein ACTSVI_02990, partial [Promethearchaeota archaeon]